jgi:hypothetical protein
MSKIDLLLKYRVPYYKTLSSSTFCDVVSGFTPVGWSVLAVSLRLPKRFLSDALGLKAHAPLESLSLRRIDESGKPGNERIAKKSGSQRVHGFTRC